MRNIRQANKNNKNVSPKAVAINFANAGVNSIINSLDQQEKDKTFSTTIELASDETNACNNFTIKCFDSIDNTLDVKHLISKSNQFSSPSLKRKAQTFHSDSPKLFRKATAATLQNQENKLNCFQKSSNLTEEMIDTLQSKLKEISSKQKFNLDEATIMLEKTFQSRRKKIVNNNETFFSLITEYDYLLKPKIVRFL